MTSPEPTCASSRSFTLRELGAADAPDAIGVIHEAFAEFEERGAASGAMLETSETLADELASGTRAIGVECEGTLVAVAKLVRSRDRALVFSRLAVLPGERRRGWPRILLEAIRDLAVADGARAYGCTVRADEPGLIAMYQHLGLTVTGHGVHRSLTGRVVKVVQLRARV